MIELDETLQSWLSNYVTDSAAIARGDLPRSRIAAIRSSVVPATVAMQVVSREYVDGAVANTVRAARAGLQDQLAVGLKRK